MKKGSSLSAILSPLDSCPCQANLTNIAQVGDILDWILRQTGPAEIFQTTFSAAEEFLRRIFFYAGRD